MLCDETRKQISGYISGDLSPEVAQAIQFHLGVCSACFWEECAERAFQEIVHNRC